MTTVSLCRCRHCGHQWLPRKVGEKPVECPKCQRRHWDATGT